MLESDLELVRGWRNAPEVRRYMWTRQEIEAANHRRWFEQASREAGRHLLLFILEGVPSGFIQFSPTKVERAVDWGFYRSPSAPRGSGWLMGATALAYAFDVLRVDKVCGQALTENEASMKFHISHGFTEEGILRDHYSDGVRRHDVAVFGLQKDQWKGSAAHAHE
jgi:UDP-4-amino-4,6-dideoxy-N-acetyl-beta-L-altrosamine N-acetyltransferase